MRRKLINGSGVIVLLALTIFLFSFMDGTRNPNAIQNTVKTTFQPGKPGFFVNRGTPTTCKDYLKPVILPSSGGLLRGVEMGMPKEQVKQLEHIAANKETDLKLVYDLELEDNVKTLITYDFSYDNQLNMVSIDFFAPNNLTTTCILNEYLGYFNARYGSASKNNEGYNNWVTQTSMNDKLKYQIYLKDVSLRDDSGISLQFIAEQPAIP